LEYNAAAKCHLAVDIGASSGRHIAGALAQSIKFLAEWIRMKKMDFSSLKTSGGMRREVIAGVAVGMIVAYGVCGVWDFWK
jgi:acid phosphatase family membrane protein YuiD